MTYLKLKQRITRPKKPLVALLGYALLTCSVVGYTKPQLIHIPSHNLSLHKGLISSSIDDIDVKPLLQSITERSGISLKIIGSISGSISFHVTNTPIEKAIEIALPKSVSFICGYNSEHRLVSLTLYGNVSADPPLKFNRITQLPATIEKDHAAPLNSREAFEFIARQEGRLDQDTINILGGMLKKRNEHQDEAKLKAIALLTDIGTPLATQILENGLGDGNPALRSASIEAIYSLKQDDAVNIIAQIYFVEKDPVVINKLIDMLKKINHPMATQIVLQHSEFRGIKRQQILHHDLLT